MILCDKENFANEVLAADDYVLVDFFGEGCVPCAALLPEIERLDGVYGERLKFCKLNTSAARRLAISQKVMGLPVIAIYKGGEKIEELVKDDATAEAVEAMIKKYI